MRPARHHDPRQSPTHRPFLETTRTVAYLPAALKWALRAEVALVAIPFGAVLGVLAPTWLGLVFLALFGSALLVWLLEVQAHAIRGRGDAPRVGVDALQMLGGAAQPLIELGALAFAGYGLFYLADMDVARWYAWVIGASLPAVFALLATEASVLRACDPRRVARVVRAGGVLGVLLAALCAVVVERVCRLAAEILASLDAGVIAAAMVDWSPDSATIGGAILAIWGTAVLAHLHGHRLHHHRETAGLEVQYAAADDVERSSVSSARTAERVVDAVAAAEARRDVAAVHQWLALPPPDGVAELAFLHDVWERLLFHRHEYAAVVVARRLVPAAATAKRQALATEVLIEAWRLSPSFEPGLAARIALLRGAFATNDDRIVRRLGTVDPARWPDDPGAVELVYLYAGWLAERGGDGRAARELLASVLDRDHALRPRIAALHGALADA